MDEDKINVHGILDYGSLSDSRSGHCDGQKRNSIMAATIGYLTERAACLLALTCRG